MITRHYSPKPQTTRQTFTTSKHAIESTYSDFPCHFKVNRDKLALTSRRWMCKRRQKIDDYRQLLEAKFRQWGKNPACGPYRKKLDRSRGHNKPIKFEDLGIRPAQMLEKK